MSEKTNPKYYKIGGTEAIKIIKLSLSPEEFKGYLKGNSLKYRLRAGKKKGETIEDDFMKALWYEIELAKAIELEPNESN